MSSGSDNMYSGYAASGVLHGLILIVIIFGLPNFMRPAPLEDSPIAVTMVNMSDVTRALHRNPHPVAKAKPQAETKPPAPKVDKPVTDDLQPTPPPPSASQPPPSPPEDTTPPKPDQAPPPPPPAAVPKPIPPPPKEKPAPPKKEPKKPVKKPDQKKPPTKTRSDEDFDNMIMKTIADTPVPPDDEKTPPRHIYKPQREAPPDSTSDATLGSEISTSELDLLQAQIKQCWSPPAGGKDESNIQVVLELQMNPDATVISVNVVDDGGKYGTDFLWTAVADSAIRAIKLCSPLKLPADKYDEWKDFNFTFKPTNLE